jgi:hypothetical protein
MIGDGDPMSVGPEITKDVFGATERGLGVDDPVLAEQRAKPAGEGSRFSEKGKLPMELKWAFAKEWAFAKGTLEASHELTAEDTAEKLLREEEAIAGGDPARVIRPEAAGGHHAVNVGMVLQSLIPGMEHAEETNLGAEVAWIACNLEQGFGAGTKQQAVDQPLVLKC